MPPEMCVASVFHHFPRAGRPRYQPGAPHPHRKRYAYDCTDMPFCTLRSMDINVHPQSQACPPTFFSHTRFFGVQDRIATFDVTIGRDGHGGKTGSFQHRPRVRADYDIL